MCSIPGLQSISIAIKQQINESKSTQSRQTLWLLSVAVGIGGRIAWGPRGSARLRVYFWALPISAKYVFSKKQESFWKRHRKYGPVGNALRPARDLSCSNSVHFGEGPEHEWKSKVFECQSLIWLYPRPLFGTSFPGDGGLGGGLAQGGG